jgi:hypothetical protein
VFLEQGKNNIRSVEVNNWGLPCIYKLLDTDTFECVPVTPLKTVYAYIDEEGFYKPHLLANELCSRLTGYNIRGNALLVQIKPGEEESGLSDEQESRLKKYLQ